MTQIPLQPQSNPTASMTADEVKSALSVVDNPISTVAQEPSDSPQIGADTKGNTLQRQLFTTVLPLTLVPLAITSVVGYTIVQRDTTADINQLLGSQALLTEELTGTNLSDDQEIIQSIGVNPLIQDLSRASGAIVIEQDLDEVSAQELEERFSQAKAIQLDQRTNAYLAELTELESFAEVIVTDRNGFNVAYSQTPSTFTQAEDQWWQQGRAQGTWVSDPEYDDSVDEFGFTISQAIEDEEGNFLGVIKGFFTSDEFNTVESYLEDAGLEGSKQVELLDASAGSRIVSFSESGVSLPADDADALDVSGGQIIAEVAGALVELSGGEETTDSNAALASIAETFPISNAKLLQGAEVDDDVEEFLLEFDFEGRRYAMVASEIVDWVAIASMDISEIQARGRGFLLLFSLVGLSLAGVGVVLTAALANRLSEPLNSLSDNAREMAAGNLDVSATPQGTSETQTLARTFNELVRRVKGSLLEQSRNTEEANLLAFITGAKVETATDLNAVFEQTVQQTRAVMAVDRMVIYRFDLNDWSGRIAAEALEGTQPSAYAQGLSDPCIPASIREKYLDDNIYLYNNISTADLHPDHLALLENLEVRSVLGTPIISQGQVYGLLIAHHCSTSHTWQPQEISFMRRVGQQLGLVIERITLREQTIQLAEEQRHVKEILQQNAMQLLIDVDPVSQGDLTVRAQVTEDEIGTVADSYNATIANLRKIVAQVQEAARQVADTTASSETSAQSLSQSAMRQADEISAALDRAQEMANSAQLVATNATKAGEAVQAAALTVQEGDEAMNRTVDGILSIRETVAETAKKVKRLGESSQKISNVVNLISGFAAQTNMLALNASIEASRAGEDSKGFAVVAEEVRELARQSAEATTEIEALVSDIQAETNEVVVAMETGTEQVVSGTKLVDETRQSLNKIAETSRQISELVESITKATVVQSQASEAVTGAMTTVAAIATQSTSEANKVYESFGDLNDVAKTLQAEVDRFKVE